MSLHGTDRFGSRNAVASGLELVDPVPDYLPSYTSHAGPHTDAKSSGPSRGQPSAQVALVPPELCHLVFNAVRQPR
jgi:hypothetical protein